MSREAHVRFWESAAVKVPALLTSRRVALSCVGGLKNGSSRSAVARQNPPRN